MNKRHAFGEADRHLQGAGTGNLVRSQGLGHHQKGMSVP